MDHSTPLTPEYEEFMTVHAQVLAALQQRDYEALRLAIQRQRAVILAHKERVESLILSA